MEVASEAMTEGSALAQNADSVGASHQPSGNIESAPGVLIDATIAVAAAAGLGTIGGSSAPRRSAPALLPSMEGEAPPMHAFSVALLSPGVDDVPMTPSFLRGSASPLIPRGVGPPPEREPDLADLFRRSSLPPTTGIGRSEVGKTASPPPLIPVREQSAPPTTTAVDGGVYRQLVAMRQMANKRRAAAGAVADSSVILAVSSMPVLPATGTSIKSTAACSESLASPSLANVPGTLAPMLLTPPHATASNAWHCASPAIDEGRPSSQRSGMDGGASESGASSSRYGLGRRRSSSGAPLPPLPGATAAATALPPKGLQNAAHGGVSHRRSPTPPAAPGLDSNSSYGVPATSCPLVRAASSPAAASPGMTSIITLAQLRQQQAEMRQALMLPSQVPVMPPTAVTGRRSLDHGGCGVATGGCGSPSPADDQASAPFPPLNAAAAAAAAAAAGAAPSVHYAFYQNPLPSPPGSRSVPLPKLLPADARPPHALAAINLRRRSSGSGSGSGPCCWPNSPAARPDSLPPAAAAGFLPGHRSE